jgi:tetratricopeptide (TPR) repeat protein
MDNKYTNTDIFKKTECPSDALLLSYVKGNISKEDKRLVELHLVDCEMCNDMVEGYQRMNPTKISSNIEAIEVSIDQAIASHQKKSIGSSSFKWYYAAAAVLIIGLTGILYNVYFTNLNSAKVADLPMPHQNEVLIDTTEKEENNNLQKNNLSEETNTKESLKTVTSEIINKEISVAEEDIALAGTAANDEVPAPVEQKMEEKSMVVFDAETTTKALSDNITFGNSTIAQPTFTGTPNTEMLSNGSAPALISPSTQLNTVDYTWTDGKKRNSDKKESAAKSKFKADKPAVAVKNEEEKDKQLESAANEKSDSISLNLLIEANQLLLQKNYNAALTKFKGYLLNKPKDCEAVNGAAQCYDATNKIADAIIYYTKLSQLKCAKQSDAAYLKLGELYVKNNQPNEAKQILQKAMQSKYLDIAEQAKKELDKL